MSDRSFLEQLLPLRVVKKIGAGGFGEVLLVQGNDGDEYAVKVEKSSCVAPQLEYEMRVYRLLRGLDCVPKVCCYWEEADKRCMAFERLGPNLLEVREHLRGSINVLLAGRWLVFALGQIHERGIVHRDIKPENILIGANDDPAHIGAGSHYYFVDFGLCKQYRHKDGGHIPWVANKKLCGTDRYASTNAHRGYEQSRRDDLESLGYTLIYLYAGTLPWVKAGHNLSRKEASKAIGATKIATGLDQLCAGCPPQLLSYMRYVRELSFGTKPDYHYLEGVLQPHPEQ